MFDDKMTTIFRQLYASVAQKIDFPIETLEKRMNDPNKPQQLTAVAVSARHVVHNVYIKYSHRTRYRHETPHTKVYVRTPRVPTLLPPTSKGKCDANFETIVASHLKDSVCFFFC